MKSLSLDRMEDAKGGCGFVENTAVNVVAGAAGAIIGIASGGLGFVVGLAVSTLWAYGCHRISS